jgi:hypothetical protein
LIEVLTYVTMSAFTTGSSVPFGDAHRPQRSTVCIFLRTSALNFRFGRFNRCLSAQGQTMAKLGRESGRFWRPVIAAVVAYAVAVQGLLIAIGGFALPAHANHGSPGFELCLHDDQGSPELPTDVPDHSGCNHCILCFAGSHHALLEKSPVLFHRLSAQIINDPWPTDKRRLHRLPHSIASPRGPPLGL